MKKFNRFLVVVISITFISCNMIALGQNPIWTLPPFYMEDFANMKSLLGGSYSISASNAMPDADGNLLFSVVDGVVYDSTGSTIGNFMSIYNSENPFSDICMELGKA